MKGSPTSSEVSYADLMARVKELQALVKASTKRSSVRRPKANVQSEQKPVKAKALIEEEQPTSIIETESQNESVNDTTSIAENAELEVEPTGESEIQPANEPIENVAPASGEDVEEQATGKLEIETDAEDSVAKHSGNSEAPHSSADSKVINLLEVRPELFTPSEEVAQVNSEVAKQVESILAINQRVQDSLQSSPKASTKEEPVGVQMKLEISSQSTEMETYPTKVNSEVIGANWGNWADVPEEDS